MRNIKVPVATIETVCKFTVSRSNHVVVLSGDHWSRTVIEGVVPETAVTFNQTANIEAL
jgi:hypothetical protein